MFASLLKATAYTAVAALLLAVPAAAGSAAAGSAPESGAYHMYRTPEQMAKYGRVPPAKGEMEYFGGSVFTSMKVVSVIWGPKVNSTTVADLPGFLSAIVNSTYVDQLKIYDTDLKGVNGHKGTNQKITRGSFLEQVQIAPKDKKTTLTDGAIRKELAYQISIGALPQQDPNTLYMIYFPTDITITLDGLTSCVQFGAYHEATSKKPTDTNIFYGVMPDCGGGFNTITVVSSHEFAEATTDNIPTPGSDPKYPQAWNTADGYEIADLCEDYYATLTAGSTTYEVQEVYLNNKAECGTSNFTSP